MRLPHRSPGFSLTEILISLAIGASILLLAVKVLSEYQVDNVAIDRAMDSETRRQEIKAALLGLLRESIRGDVFFDDAVANYMQLNWYNPTPGPRGGSLLVAPSSALEATTGGVATGDPSDVLILLTNSSLPKLSLTNAVTFSDTEASGASSKDLSVTGSLSSYRIGDLLAISSIMGTEFVRLEAIRAGNQINVRVFSANSFPCFSLDSGTAIYKARVKLIGKVAGENTMRISEALPAGNYDVSSSFPLPLILSLRVERYDNVGAAWLGAPKLSFTYRSSDYLLRLAWRRAPEPAARGPATNFSRLTDTVEIRL